MESPHAATLHALFVAAVRQHGDRTFLSRRGDHETTTMTYREAMEAIAANVSRLQELGVRRGDYVVAYADDVTSMMFFLLCCAFGGFVFCSVAATGSMRSALRLAERVGARHYFTTIDVAPLLRAEGITPICFIPANTPSEGVHPLDLDARAPEKVEAIIASAPTSSAHPLAVICTSGSTGEPKIVLLSHRRTFGADAVCNWLQLSPDRPERVLICSSFAHSQVTQTLCLGLQVAATLVVPRGLEGAARLDDIVELDPTFIRVSPRVVKSLYAQHVERGGDPKDRFFAPSLRVLRTSGGPGALDMLKLFASQGIDVGEACGSTEAGVMFMTPFGSWRPRFAGKPLPGLDVRIAEDGEIEVRSPGLMIGYVGDEQATREAVTPDGFYRLGDFGELSPDGYLRILGRKKEILNAPDGTNVSAVRIEDMITALPWVSQVIVVGDQKPFITTLIVIKDEVHSLESDGYLPEGLHPDLYERATAALGQINEHLEGVERVRRCSLFSREMPSDLYSARIDEGKVKRRRPGINAHYHRRIDAMYE